MDTDRSKMLTNFEAFLHIVKTTIGGGFLAMPEAFHHAGVIVGFIGILILGFSVLNMMSFLVRCSQKLRSHEYAAIIAADRRNRGKCELQKSSMEYPETVEAVFRYGANGRFAWCATFARIVTACTLLITYYGVNIIYVCIVANSSKQLIDQYYSYGNNSIQSLSIHYYPSIVSGFIMCIGMVSNLKALVLFSKVANILICSGAAIIMGYLIIGVGSPAESDAQLIVFPISRWSLFAGTALCSLEGIGMLMKIENNMARPKDLAGPPAYTLHISMIVIIIVNAVLGVLGYLRYGSNVLGSISLNLPNDRFAAAVKIVITLGILLSYGLQLNVTADLVWPVIRRVVNILKPGFLDMTLNVELTPYQNGYNFVQRHQRRSNVVYYSMRFMLIVGTIIIATIEPHIEPLISLVGSVGFSVLGLIIPALMETVWYWCPKDTEDDSSEDNKELVELMNFWNVNTAFTYVGMSSLWATISGISIILTGSRTNFDAKTTSKGRIIKKYVRHLKNILIVILAVFALIGGAMYNIQQIMLGDSQLKSVM